MCMFSCGVFRFEKDEEDEVFFPSGRRSFTLDSRLFI
jgi:hypothetical protein